MRITHWCDKVSWKRKEVNLSNSREKSGLSEMRKYVWWNWWKETRIDWTDRKKTSSAAGELGSCSGVNDRAHVILTVRKSTPSLLGTKPHTSHRHILYIHTSPGYSNTMSINCVYVKPLWVILSSTNWNVYAHSRWCA